MSYVVEFCILAPFKFFDMIEYIRGKVVSVNPSFTIVETNNIGYFINISLNTFSTLKKDSEQQFFIHEIIREDTHALYGFLNDEERTIFRHLISVSGIGANTARLILSSMTPTELQEAIASGNVGLIKQVKGIGLKTAQRLVVDLKDKIGKLSVDDNFLTVSNNTIKEEALSALVTLGFPKKQIEKTVEKILVENTGISVEDLIKEVLKNQ